MRLVREARAAEGRFDGPACREALPLLVEQATLALQAGVALTLGDYEGLSVIERAAFAKAGEALRAAQAQRIGVASQSDLGAALVTAEHDGGEAAESLIFDAIHEQAVAHG